MVIDSRWVSVSKRKTRSTESTKEGNQRCSINIRTIETRSFPSIEPSEPPTRLWVVEAIKMFCVLVDLNRFYGLGMLFNMIPGKNEKLCIDSGNCLRRTMDAFNLPLTFHSEDPSVCSGGGDAQLSFTTSKRIKTEANTRQSPNRNPRNFVGVFL